MRNIIIISLLLAFFTCQAQKPFIKHKQMYVCGLVRSIVINPDFELSNFSGFLDANLKPLITIMLDTQRVYSPDYKYYFKYSLQNTTKFTRKATLYNKENDSILEINNLVKGGETPIWLDNGIIVSGTVHTDTNFMYKKDIINFKTKTIKEYFTDYAFSFKGQTNINAFYASQVADQNRFGNELTADGGDMISLGNTIKNLKDSKNVTSHNNDTHSIIFYNSYFSIKSIRPKYPYNYEELLETTIISNKGKIIANLKTNAFYNFYINTDCYFNEDAVYLKINHKEIYKITQTSCERIFEFTSDNMSWIRDFKVEGNYLILRIQTQGDGMIEDINAKGSFLTMNGLSAKQHVYGHLSIGIVDLKTKKITYPKIKR